MRVLSTTKKWAVAFTLLLCRKLAARQKRPISPILIYLILEGLRVRKCKRAVKMYNKILENYRKHLARFQQQQQQQQQEAQQPPEAQQPQEAQRLSQEVQEQHSPQAEQNNQLHNEEEEQQARNTPSPIAGPSRERQPRQDHFLTFPVNENDHSFLIYENENLKVYIEKKLHQRHKRFKLQDFLYNVKIKVKDNVDKPLLKDLLEILEKVLTFILNHIRSNFDENDHNIVYIDLFQSPMINALNSGGFSLQDKSNEVVERLLSILNQFLISDNNLNLEINDTFKIYINVFSVDHVTFKNRNPRTQPPKKKRKHYGSNTNRQYKFSWAIDVPESYQHYTNIFKNKCFLLCIILGLLQNAYFKSNRVDTRYLHAQGINYLSKKKQNYAGNILKYELEKMITNLSLDENGPYDLIETSTKITNFYNCQIYIFGGFETSTKLKCVIPKEINDELIPIYLYEPFDNENHLLFIKNLSSYFKSNRQICFDCKKSFKSYHYMHRCIRTISCFACRRKFAKKTTYLHEKLKENFCDSKLNTVEKIFTCKICNCTLKSQHCTKGHQRICNGKGQFGFKCLKCHKFTYRRNNDTSGSLKEAHQCGFLRCKFCGSYYDENSFENIHVCPLKIETVPKNWPSLCFLKLASENNTSENCTVCYDLNLQNASTSVSSTQVVCDFHKNNIACLEPNLIILYKEHNVQRGHFNRIVFSNLISNSNTENILYFDYINGLNVPSTFINKSKKHSQDIDIVTKILNKTSNDKLSVMKQFLKLLLCDNFGIWQNTTFVIQDEDSFTLNLILETSLNLGIAPEIVRNGKNIYLVSLPHLKIKFIRINNYLSGNEFDIAKQFNVPFENHFFPEKFNIKSNFEYCGPIPESHYFFNFTDSTQEITSKQEFIDLMKNNNSEWNFKDQLFHNTDLKVKLLTIATLTFLKNCLTLQNLLQTTDKKHFIHPFGTGLCTIASFTFKLYKVIYLNNFPIFSIQNEYGLNGKEISAQEAEWAAYYTYKYPQLQYFSSLGHPKGQKYFLETVPDLYSPISKEAKFYCGCFWHGHFENCLINPNATAETKNEVLKKSYLELNNEFNKKINLLLINHPNEVKFVSVYWECEYLKKRDTNQGIKDFINNHYSSKTLIRLNPRSTIRGAFIDNFGLKWTQKENLKETFYCLDLNGMYSFCAIKNPFMIGPYKVLIGPIIENIKFINDKFCFENENNKMFGTMHVTITAPKTLYVPYLLYRLENGSTVNTLCSKCAESKSNTKCTHSDIERAITASYFISELNYAISLGYKIIKIHECHYYQQADYVLKDFVQKINCLKIQCTNLLYGKSIEEQENYCSYLNSVMELTEPFNLSINNINPNESSKSLYKLISNSLFGKLEQKHFKSKTVFAQTQSQLEDIYFSDKTIKEIFALNETVCQVEIETDISKQPPNRDSNCYLGGQLTAYARQLIHEYIETISLNGKLFYVDCDSIYFSLPNHLLPSVPISDAVGHFKHVYPGKVESFYSLGPKSYVISYRDCNNKIKSITKVKGITLTSHYLENELNSTFFQSFMTDYLKDQIKKIELSQLRSRKTNKKVFKVETKMETISLSNQLTNRRLVAPNCKYLSTFPYGYEYYP